jgi:tetratricopeptide (TPR) repeat protein
MTATLSPATTPASGSPQTSWEQMNETGRRLYGEGNMTGAELAFVAAIEEGERPGSGVDPLRLASSISNLAQLKYQQKDTGHAEELFRRALELREGVLGAEHPTVVSSINNLAALYVARGALDEAEPLLQRAMTATTKRLEAAQADLSVNINNMVRLYYKRGEYTRAEPLLLQLLASKRPLGAEHPDIAAVLVSLAKLRQSMGRPDAAERVWRRVLAVRDRTLPPTDPGILAVLDGLAEACAAQGKAEDEYVVRERALRAREQVLGGDHPALAAARARMEELRSAVAAATATTTLSEMAPPETPSPRRSVEVIDVGPAGGGEATESVPWIEPTRLESPSAAIKPAALAPMAPLHERKAAHSAGRPDKRGSQDGTIGTMWIVAAACVAVAIAGVLIFGRDLLSAARPQASTAVAGAHSAGSPRGATPHVTIGASTPPAPAVGPVVAPATQPVQVRALTLPRALASRGSHPRVTGAPNGVVDSSAIGDARAPPTPPSPAVDFDAATRGIESSAPSKPQ